jgi:N-acetylmuramoyl-L-alanine amidase
MAKLSTRNRLEKSEELARHLQTALVQGIGSTSKSTAKDRGVKSASFAVLLGTQMPSVLAEVSFLSNPRDAEFLRTEQFRDRIAVSLASGLDQYLRNRSVEPPQDRK